MGPHSARGRARPGQGCGHSLGPLVFLWMRVISAEPLTKACNSSRTAPMFSIVTVPLALQNVFSTLLKPISEQIQMVQNLREKNRGSKQFNHLSAVSESIPALGWVAMVRNAGKWAGGKSLAAW